MKAVRCGACSIDGYRALARIAERRGNLSGAAKHWDVVSKLRPSAVRPHYEAARLYIIGLPNLEKAYHHAAKARDLHLGPKPDEDVSEGEMKDLLAEVSGACLQAAAIDLAHVRSVRLLYEKMVWLMRAHNLMPSSSVYEMLARYHERLGDLSPGDRRVNHYDQALGFLEKARKLKPGSPVLNALFARCLGKRRAGGQ